MENKGAIVILGGMGPQASAKMLQEIVETATSRFGAKNDDDFPEVIVNSIPVPNFISNEQSIKTVRQMLKTRIKKLENFNPQSFCIACNTAHILLKDLQASTKVPFISMIQEVSKAVELSGILTVGLLGTPVTLKSGIYQEALSKTNIKIIIPSPRQQKETEKIIKKVLTGQAGKADTETLSKIAESLTKKQAQGIILGCTELPLIFPEDFKLPVFNSIKILSRAVLEKFYTN